MENNMVKILEMRDPCAPQKWEPAVPVHVAYALNRRLFVKVQSLKFG